MQAMKLVLNLFGLHKVGDMSNVIDAAYVEPGASALTAEPRDEAGLALPLCGVDRADFNSATHDLYQPVAAVNVVLLQVQVQTTVPAIHIGITLRSAQN